MNDMDTARKGVLNAVTVKPHLKKHALLPYAANCRDAMQKIAPLALRTDSASHLLDLSQTTIKSQVVPKQYFRANASLILMSVLHLPHQCVGFILLHTPT